MANNKQLNLVGTNGVNVDVNVSGNLNIGGAEIFSTVDTKITNAIKDTVPNTRKINSKLLDKDITLTYADVHALSDSTKIPSQLSELTDDPTHRTVTDTEKTTWNAKSNFSGNYNDLTNKPTIPSIAGLASTEYVNTQLLSKADKSTLGTAASKNIGDFDVSGAADTALKSANNYTDNAVATLIDSAPEALNTLGEIAAALKDDDGIIDTLYTVIGTKVDKKDNYAGSASPAGPANSTKGTLNLTVGSTAHSFNGSADRDISITPATIGAATSSHHHNSSYYTKTEINGKVEALNTDISGKSDTGHGHAIADVTDLSDILNTKFNSAGGTISGNVTITNGSSSQKNEPNFQWKTINENTPYIGFATDQTDGTFMVGSLRGTGYQSGLAIGGGSTNLLWKGNKVISQPELDTALSGKANSSHNHAASNITSGTLSSDRLPTIPIAKGGTGATSAADALINLGITATAAELNKLDGVTATTAELNYVDGVTSNIQTQLNNKAASNHTHDVVTSTVNGFMSADDKKKLDLIAAGANKYIHPAYTARTGKPTANQTPAFGGTVTISQIVSDTSGHVKSATDRTITIPDTLSNGKTTAGLIKTTSTVTSTSGLTACPVISGVPYYKNTTYSSLKNPYSLTIQGNGTTLTNGTYDGSAAKTVNITPGSIGGAPFFTVTSASDMTAVFATLALHQTATIWIEGAYFKTLTNSLDAGNQAHGYATKLTDSILELRVGGGGYRWTIRVNASAEVQSVYSLPDDLQTTALRDQATVSNARARNITCQTTDATAGSSSLVSGRILFIYS